MTERAAGTSLPLGRALHLASMLAIALLVNAVALATWVPEGDSVSWENHLLRHALLLTGVALLAALAIAPRLSWVAPALVAMPGLVMGYIRVEQAQIEGREAPFFHNSWHPMLLAVNLFVFGVAAVILRGERPAEPDDAAE